jgi:hypothetical protein
MRVFQQPANFRGLENVSAAKLRCPYSGYPQCKLMTFGHSRRGYDTRIIIYSTLYIFTAETRKRGVFLTRFVMYEAMPKNLFL